MSRAGLDKAPADVAAMFDGVARRYDLTNDVLSAGQARRWRHAVCAALDLRPGQRVLDLAAGTATSSVPMAARGATVVACDFSLGMLREGARRGVPGSGVALVAGDGLSLPFPDETFDRVTISFGLRNTARPLDCLAELRRVTRPGGRVVVCEFSTPVWAPLRVVYTEYLMRALPEVARRVAANPDAYVYLAESIRAWPSQPELAGWMEQAGWRRPQWRDLSGGIVALHRAERE